MPFQLIVDIRIFRRCALIPNSNKLMIMTWSYTAPIAQVVDIENESVTMTGPLMTKTNGRLWTLQMDVIKINGEDRLAMFGAILEPTDSLMLNYLDRIELYNSQTNKWETSDKTFNGKQRGFDFLKIKLSEIIPELRCSVDYFRSTIGVKRKNERSMMWN